MAAVVVVEAASEEVLVEAVVAAVVVVADKHKFIRLLLGRHPFQGVGLFVLRPTMCKKLADNLTCKAKSPIFVPSFKTRLL